MLNDIEKTVTLSRVKAKDEVRDVSRILSYVEKLKSVDTSQTEPLFHFPETSNSVREDAYKHTSPQVRKMMTCMREEEGEFLRVSSILC